MEDADEEDGDEVADDLGLKALDDAGERRDDEEEALFSMNMFIL